MRSLKVFTDKKLYQRYRPRLILDGQEVRTYPYRGGSLRPGYNVLPLEESGRIFLLAVQAAPEHLTGPSRRWHVDTRVDFRLSANVSLIKAAHLSMFSMVGYRYALSSVGVLHGYSILGTFFRQNQTEAIKRMSAQERTQKIQENALIFFHEFKHMVRALQANERGPQGTDSDNRIAFCSGPNGNAWGIIVYVKTGHLANAVLLPLHDNPDAVAKFLEFLGNDSETLYIAQARRETDDDGVKRWKINPERISLNWPKNDALPDVTH
jgi:hypothetical protein